MSIYAHSTGSTTKVIEPHEVEREAVGESPASSSWEPVRQLPELLRFTGRRRVAEAQNQTLGGGGKEPWIRELACHTCLATAGWADASSGPLLPYIQSYYHISYEVVSMIFVGAMVGCMLAAAANAHLTARFGLGKVVILGATVQLIGYGLVVPAFPFPVLPIAYAVSTWAVALNDAQCNSYIATLPNFEHKFAYLHASYGLGAVLCPLAATAFASHGIKFSYFFAMSCGLTVINGCILLYAFRFSYRIDNSSPSSAPPGDIALERVVSSIGASAVAQELGAPPAEHTIPPIKQSLMREALTNKSVVVFSLFITVYVGAEVSMGGWAVTFVQENRDGGPSAGYIATGFWLGILLGRATLSYLNVRVGEKRVVFYYLATAIALEFVIWFAKNVIADGVAISLVGFVMGPSYPIVMSLSAKTLPRRLHTTAIGFMTAIGTVGSALFPFVIGALSQKYSPAALQPTMIALLACQAAVWCFVPEVDKKEA